MVIRATRILLSVQLLIAAALYLLATSILAVTHVTPIKALVARALGAPPTSFFTMELSPAALTRLTCTGTEAVLRSFNDVSHLR